MTHTDLQISFVQEEDSVAEKTNIPSQEQSLFWQELVELKRDACYVRNYRDATGKWVTSIGTLRAFTSTGSIAGWLIWKQLAYLWAGLIAISQLADALKDVFPFSKRGAALSRWCRTLNKLFVEAQGNWEDISGGRCTNPQIRRLLKQIRSRKQQAEAKYIPHGLTKRTSLLQRAEQESAQFFAQRYNVNEEDL